MKARDIAALAAAIMLLSSAASLAQETTTTTTTRHRETAAGPGLTVGVPGVVGVHVGAPATAGCTTHKSTTTNEDTGNSRSVTRSNC